MSTLILESGLNTVPTAGNPNDAVVDDSRIKSNIEEAKRFQSMIAVLSREYGPGAQQIVSDEQRLAEFVQKYNEREATAQSQAVATQIGASVVIAPVPTSFPQTWSADQITRAHAHVQQLHMASGGRFSKVVVLPNYEQYAEGPITRKTPHMHGVVANVAADTPVRDLLPILQGLGTCTVSKNISLSTPITKASAHTMLASIKSGISTAPTRVYDPIQAGDARNVQTWDLNWSNNPHNAIGIYYTDDDTVSDKDRTCVMVRAQQTPQVSKLLKHAVDNNWSIGSLMTSQSYLNMVDHAERNAKWVLDYTLRNIGAKQYASEVDTSQPKSSGSVYTAPRLAVPDAQAMEGTIQTQLADPNSCTVYSGAVNIGSLLQHSAQKALVFYAGHMQPLRVLAPGTGTDQRVSTLMGLGRAAVQTEFGYPGEARREPVSEVNQFKADQIRAVHVADIGAPLSNAYMAKASTHREDMRGRAAIETAWNMRDRIPIVEYTPIGVILP